MAREAIPRVCVLRMSRERSVTAFAVGTLLLSSLALSGCVTSTEGSSLMDARAEGPAAPKTSAYPPVEDAPPKRAVPAMTADEQSKLKKDLTAARDRQKSIGKKDRGVEHR
jgi:hypothetical protein